MERVEGRTVTAVDELAALYAQPSERVLNKELDHVNAAGRAFIAASPFLVLATGSSQGLDCSPKGDYPGFVQVEDDGRTLLIPDRRGNNRIDSIKNVVDGFAQRVCGSSVPQRRSPSRLRRRTGVLTALKASAPALPPVCGLRPLTPGGRRLTA